MLTILAWLLGAVFLLAAFTLGYFALATRRIAAESERLVPPQGKFIEVDGNTIHYVETGEGLPIVFVHGLGGQLHHFRHTLFKDFGPDYRLIALDRPGSGYSTRKRGATGGLSEQAELIVQFIKKLGLEKPFVVGHSLGGAITLTLAVEHPDAISGIALLSPLTHLETEIRPEFKSLYIPSRALRWLVANTVAVPGALKYAEKTLAFVFGPQAAPADYGIQGGGFSGLRPSHFYATATDIVAIQLDLARIEERYGEIVMPAGMMFGTADRVLDFATHGQPMPGRIKDLDFERIEGLGHMPQFIDAPRVTNFIRRIAARAFAGRLPDSLSQKSETTV